MLDAAISLVLADDHPIFRDGVMGLLASAHDVDVVGQAGTGEDALRAVLEKRPDVAVLDIAMPGLDGIAVIRRAREMQITTRFAVLSVYEDWVYVEQALDAGATGYLVKRSLGAILLNAVRAVRAGGLYLDPCVSGRRPTAYRDRGGQRREPGPAAIALTEREEEVLRLVAYGFTAKEVAGKLGIASKSVETHKARAAEKLGLCSRAKIVNYALLKGWLHS